MRISFLVLALLALLPLSLAACGDASDSTDGSLPPLRVGLEAEYAPFETKTSTGEIQGFDVDLVRRLGKELGREVIIQDLAFDSLLLKLAAGDLDMVCSGLSFTDMRAKKVDFSEPYVHLRMGVLLGNAQAAGITQVEELDKKAVIITVQRGTTGAMKAHARFPNATIHEYDRENDAANELVVGRAHAFVYDMVSVHRWNRQHPTTTSVLPHHLGVEDYCIAFRKGSALRDRVNAKLQSAEVKEWLNGQMSKWFDEEQRALFVR